MTKDEIIKALRDMAKYPTVTLPRDCEALRMAADLLAQSEHGWTPERIVGIARLKEAQDKKLAQRTWVGLTDEEIQYCVELKNPEAIAEEVEAKLKEKNT